jgi:hypothetical protein
LLPFMQLFLLSNQLVFPLMQGNFLLHHLCFQSFNPDIPFTTSTNIETM